MDIAHKAYIKKEMLSTELCYSGSHTPPRKHDSSRIKSRELTQGAEFHPKKPSVFLTDPVFHKHHYNINYWY